MIVFLTWSVFQVPNLVLILPDFFQIILLVLSREWIQWILVWLEQDFWNRNSEVIGLFSTVRSISVKMTAFSFVCICYFAAAKSQLCWKELQSVVAITHLLLCYSSLNISFRLSFSGCTSLSFQAKFLFVILITNTDYLFWSLVLQGLFSLSQRPENTTILESYWQTCDPWYVWYKNSLTSLSLVECKAST